MTSDMITDEIREIRRRLAARFDNDIDRICADVRQRQAASGGRTVRLPKRRPRLIATTNNPMHGSGGPSVSGDDEPTSAAP